MGQSALVNVALLYTATPSSFSHADALEVLGEWSRLCGDKPGLLENFDPALCSKVIDSGLAEQIVAVLRFTTEGDIKLEAIPIITRLCIALFFLCAGKSSNQTEAAKQLVVDALPVFSKTFDVLAPNIGPGTTGAGAMVELVRLIAALWRREAGDGLAVAVAARIEALKLARIDVALTSLRSTDARLKKALEEVLLDWEDRAWILGDE